MAYVNTYMVKKRFTTKTRRTQKQKMHEHIIKSPIPRQIIKNIIPLPENPYFDGQFQLDEKGTEALLLDKERYD